MTTAHPNSAATESPARAPGTQEQQTGGRGESLEHLIIRARLAAASEQTLYGGTAGLLLNDLADALSAAPAPSQDAAPALGEEVRRLEWHLPSEEPAIGRKIVCLWDDGSGACLLYRHDDGYIDQDGEDCAEIGVSVSRWAYVPGDHEFFCEHYAGGDDEPMHLPVVEDTSPAQVAPVDRGGEPTLADACKPWKFHVGEPPDDDSPLLGVYDAGLTYAFDLLAKAIGAEGYQPGDGTETWEGDVAGTLHNILVAGGVICDETGARAVLPSATTTPASAGDGDLRADWLDFAPDLGATTPEPTVRQMVAAYYRRFPDIVSAEQSEKWTAEYLAVLAPTAKPEPAGREEIARIIDPEAEKHWQRCFNCRREAQGDAAAAACADYYAPEWPAALSKADAILAARPVAEGVAGWPEPQAIRHAPANGRFILCGFQGQFDWMPFVARGNGPATAAPGYSPPTHFWELPPAPATPSEGEQ